MRSSRVRATDESAFWARTFEAHLDDVLNYYLFRVGSRELAEELCSAAFERAWTKRHQFDARRGSARTWLLAIAATVGKNHARGARPSQCAGELELVDERSPEPAELLVRSEAIAEVRVAIMSLPPRERELIALKYGAHETNRGIARITGLTESNVGTIIHRALRKLRAVLDDEEEADGTG